MACAIESHRSTLRLATLGFLTGFVGFLGTLYWVVPTMKTYGGLPALVAAGVGVLMSAYLAIYPALFGVLLGWAVRRFGAGGVWLAPWLWVATEWLRANTLLQFPWALLGSSQASVLPVAQLASVGGVYGLSALVALVSTAAATLALGQRRVDRIAAVGVGMVLLAVVGLGMVRLNASTLTTAGRPLRVGLIQGNIDQDSKWDARYRDVIVNRYLALSRQALSDGAQLVIWPESSTPFYFDAESVMAAPIRRLAAETNTPFLVGTDELVPARNGSPDRYYNAASLLGGDGRTRATYRKMMLVPFGEYVPMKRLLFFVGPLVEAVSDFTAGVDPLVFDSDGRRFSVAICYEAVSPGISRAFVRGGSQLLATITNDAWFGRTSAGYQHFEQAGLRAIEEGRYVVRAANTGISGAIDPYGRVIEKTELFVPLALTVDVRLLDERTIYSRVGDVVAWAGVVLAAFVAVTAGRRRR